MKKTAGSFHRKNLIGYLYIPASLIYLEAVVFLLAGGVFHPLNFLAMVFVSLAAGCIFSLLSSLSSSDTLNSWIALILIEAVTLIYIVTFFVQDTYQNYVNIATVFEGAGGIFEEFGDALLNIVTHNVPKLLLFEAPALLFLLLCIILKLFRIRKNPKKRALAYLGLFFLLFELCGCALLVRSQTNRIRLMAEYEFNTAVRCFSVQTGLKLDLCYLAFGNPAAGVYIVQENNILFSDSGDAQRYGENRMEIDFAALSENADNPDAERISAFAGSLRASAKNSMTGLFKGKNLIFISVEAMSKEMIREDTMPTLYHMLNSGIVFEDYYQPYWNGSTSTGEFSNLLGLLPTKALTSCENTKGKNLYFTIGNALIREGYFSRAYHNGTVGYYDRNITHPNFGYEEFIANGNGMEEGLSGSWPESDLEMMQYALPRFAGQAPFSVYFMTLSGHFPYYHDLSVMVEKYGERTESLGFSDIVDAYLCAEIDFEEAVKYLTEELERRGLLENTVFVLAPDHYPYGLTENEAWATDRDYLPELYGFAPSDMMERDHNALIIWSPVLETMEPAVISDPSSSVDILPTLLNLFGEEFDSRLLAGRDVFSDAEGLVIWPDYSWRTARGTYYALTDTFVSADEGPEDPEYTAKLRAIVRNKMTFSDAVLETDYYDLLFGN